MPPANSCAETSDIDGANPSSIDPPGAKRRPGFRQHSERRRCRQSVPATVNCLGVSDRCGGRANEQAIDAVVEQLVVVDLRSDAIVIGGEFAGLLEFRRLEARFLEAIGGRTDGGVGTLGDLVERDRRTQIDELNRVDQLLDRVDQEVAAAAVANLGVVDALQEDALIFQVATTFVLVESRRKINTTPVTG